MDVAFFIGFKSPGDSTSPGQFHAEAENLTGHGLQNSFDLPMEYSQRQFCMTDMREKCIMQAHSAANWNVKTGFPKWKLDGNGIHVNPDVCPACIDRGGEESMQAAEHVRRMEDMTRAATARNLDMDGVIRHLEDNMSALRQDADSLVQQWEENAVQLQTAREAQRMLMDPRTRQTTSGQRPRSPGSGSSASTTGPARG